MAAGYHHRSIVWQVILLIDIIMFNTVFPPVLLSRHASISFLVFQLFGSGAKTKRSYIVGIFASWESFSWPT